MDINYGKVVDVESALSAFSYQELYSASINLFRAMNYPVEESDVAVNVAVNNFIYNCVEKKQYYSSGELDSLKNVDRISYLFKISQDSAGLDTVNPIIIDNQEINSIIFLAVELKGTSTLRSYNANDLTQVLSRCYSSPVILLFRHEREIMLAGQACFIETKKQSKVFLSDWYSSQESNIAVLYRLSGLCLENCSNKNFHEMFLDMLWSVARIYYTYPEKSEKLTNGMFSYDYVYSRYSLDDEDQIGNQLARQIQDLEEGQFYYNKIYGDDYVDDEMILESIKEEEWLYDEGDILFDPDIFDESGILNHEALDETNDEQDDVVSADETEEIDDELFDDPIKLLEYIENKDD